MLKKSGLITSEFPGHATDKTKPLIDASLSSIRLNRDALTTSILWHHNQPKGELVVAEVPAVLQRWNMLSETHLV